MKILAVSDRLVSRLYTAEARQSYPGVELIIGCGDLPFYYLEFLTCALDAPLVYVRGNHDLTPQYTADGRAMNEVEGGQDLHGRTLSVDGVLLAGLEGSMRYKPDAPHMYSEQEMSVQVARLLPKLALNRARYGRALDILVTHSPPYGIHDEDDMAHRGFRVFRSFLRYVKPRYLVHGHVHVYRSDTPRQTRYHETTVINVYPAHVFEFSPAEGASAPQRENRP
jgi:Icc-related predicted phosphoesterase